MSWQLKMMQNLKRNWLAVSKLTWRIWQTLIRALKSLKHLHLNGLLFTKLSNVWGKKVQSSYVWWHWRLMQNMKEIWLVLSKLSWVLENRQRLKNSDFILESTMAKLNQNKIQNNQINQMQCENFILPWK